MVAQAKAASQGKPTTYEVTKDLPKGVVGNTEVIKAGTLVELTDTQFSTLASNMKDPTIVRKPQSMKVESFFLNSGEPISLRKVGTNFYDLQGNVVDFSTPKYDGAFSIDDSVSYEIKQKETSKKRMQALVQNLGIDAGGVTVGTSLEQGGTTDRERDMFVKFSVPKGEESKTIVFDALAIVQGHEFDNDRLLTDPPRVLPIDLIQGHEFSATGIEGGVPVIAIIVYDAALGRIAEDGAQSKGIAELTNSAANNASLNVQKPNSVEIAA